MANDDALEMTFRLRGTPEAVAAVEQFRRMMSQAGKRRDVSPMARELDHLRRGVNSIANEIGSVVRPALGGFAFSVSGLALGLTAAAVGLNHFSSSLIEVREGAQRVGLTIKEYRGFVDAASKVAIARPEAIAMMENFNKVVYEAKTRTHGVWEEIVRLGGADVVGAVLNAKNPVDQMAVVWQRLEYLKGTDPAKARKWAELWFSNIKAARIEWSSAMEEMAQAAGLTDEQIKSAKAYHEEWVKAGVAWERMKDTVGVAAMRALTPLAEALSAALENKDAIKALSDGLHGLTSSMAQLTPSDVEAISTAIGGLLKGLGEGLGSLASGLSGIMDLVDRIQDRRSRGEPWFGTVDPFGMGNVKPDAPKATPGAVRDDAGNGFWGWMQRTLGRPAKDAGEKLEQVNTEYQQLIDAMRGTPGALTPTERTLMGMVGAATGGNGSAGSGGLPRMNDRPIQGASVGGAPVTPSLGKKDVDGVDAFIMHHTGGRGTVEGVQNTLRQRGLGVEYIMDRDGNIFQSGGRGASHMMKGWGPIGEGLSNRNTVGMEIIARNDRDVTEAQVKAAREFVAKNYPNTPVYGHGQVNPGHKEADEGMKVVNSINAERRGSTFDRLNAGRISAAAQTKNTFDITIDADAAAAKRASPARIPSSLVDNAPRQTPMTGTGGIGTAP